MTKELIKFQTQQYEQARYKYSKYLTAVDDAISYIETETGIKLTRDQIRDGRAFETLKREFENKHKKGNTLNLKAIKLMQLMEVNLNHIITKIDGLKVHPIKTEPKKENYSIYAETPEQIERLNVVKTIMKCYEKLGLKSPSDLQVNKPLLWNGQYKVNPYYIKKA